MTGVHGRAPRAESAQNGTTAARPAVRPKHGRAGCLARPCRLFAACSSRFFYVFVRGLASLFGPLLNLLESIFRVELELGLG